MRDKLVHDYFGVDREIVWATVQNKLPELQGAIKKMKHSRDQEKD